MIRWNFLLNNLSIQVLKEQNTAKKLMYFYTFIDLTTVMSAGFNVSKAATAASIAGIASAKSLSQSSLMA